MIERMRNLRAITYRGPIVALVIGDRAVIDDTMEPHERGHVKEVCRYTLGLDELQRAAVYTDAAADAYARRARARPGAHGCPPQSEVLPIATRA
ncbi:MAG TPA: hypothetical protein VGH56_09475 [Solirubrobacteraceae bacterium]|jgi:hypothetical protein